MTGAGAVGAPLWSVAHRTGGRSTRGPGGDDPFFDAAGRITRREERTSAARPDGYPAITAEGRATKAALLVRAEGPGVQHRSQR